MSIEIPFRTGNAQFFLAKAGGYIAVKPSGRIVFQFDKEEHYLKYQLLIEEDKHGIKSAASR